MRVILWSGTEYTPKKVYFHQVLFWTYVVFDEGLIMVQSKYVKKIVDDPEQPKEQPR